jgi:outer membrane receptor protein involved in Fe transport
MHFDAGAALTRDHHADLFLGTIIEGPNDWKVRPVAEVTYEREFNAKETFGILGGAIWQVGDNLTLDVGLREAWINHHPETEIRAGLTFAISPQREAAERVRQSMRE